MMSYYKSPLHRDFEAEAMQAALYRQASTCRSNGYTPVQLIGFYYQPGSMNGRQSRDEMNESLSRAIGWCWGPIGRRK